MSSKYVVGVDLGGTKISTALCGFDGGIICELTQDTRTDEGVESVVQRMVVSINSVMASAKTSIVSVAGIGVSSPGPLSVSEGTVIFAPMLNWKNVHLRDMLLKAFDVPVFLENDTNAAAYGEKCLGAGKGYNNIVYVTVSTGVSCGIIANGEIVHGNHDYAGELGHICVVPNGRLCACGNKGCLETYASGPGIVAIAREMDLHDTEILAFAGNDVNNLDCPGIANAARNNDSLALELWKNAGEKLGLGISIVAQLLDPDIVILGGGVTEAWDLFYDHMIHTVSKHSYPMISKDLRIIRAGLGQRAGLLGAALLAAHQTR